jgi:hypothetical protein
LRQGLAKLIALFGSRFRPVLVPPWNRIDEPVVRYLPSGGYSGLSVFGPRANLEPVPGIIACNTHVDPLSWRGGPRFAGQGKVLKLFVEALQARRSGTVDPAEPVGLLTHHLHHDAAAWDFLDHLLAVTASHPGTRWVSTDVAFALPAPPSIPAG